MSSIDERIVQMQFDNNQFESGVKTTLNTLEKLKSSLKLQDATKGFEDVNKSVKGLDLNPLINSVETVSNRFSTLGIIGTTALINITNKAIDAGEKLVRSLSIDQVAAGWSKYADKTAAVQTIMAATMDTWQDSAKALEFEGTQMEFVNDQLDKLNWFTDETSYNFLDMVNNIGKFTNNGVQLQDAVTSMEGISTWAALSGANITDAGRAMYNFSQAMGAGAMKLQDWKSIENANMATVEFKQAAIDTALELGKLTKAEEDVFKAAEPLKGKGTEFGLATFSQSLKDGWFDTEVMVKTLEKFGGFTDELNRFLESPNIDKYYYSTSRLLDDLDKFNGADAAGQMEILEKASRGTGKSVDELREEFEKLNSSEFDIGRRAFKAAQEAKTFAEAIDSVKDAVSTGWMNTFELIFGNYEEAKVLWTDLANSLYDVFAEAGNVRNDMLQIWRDLGGREALLEGLYHMFSSLLRLTEPLSDAFHEVFHTGADFVNEMGWNLTVATARFRDFVSSLWLTDTSYSNLTDSFKGLFTILKAVIGAFKTAVSIASAFLHPLNVLAEVVFAVTGRIGRMITGAEEVARKSSGLKSAIDTVRKAVQALADILTVLILMAGTAAMKFLDWVETSNVAQKVLDNLRGALYVLGGAFKMALYLVGTFIVKVVEIAEKVVPRVRQAFSDLWANMVEAFPALGEIRTKIGNFMRSLSKIKGPTEVFDKLRAKIELLGKKANPVLDKVGKHIWNLLKNIKNFTVTNAPKAFKLLADSFAGLGKVVTSVGSGMRPVFDSIAKALGIFIDKIKALDWGGIAASAQAKASVIANVLVSVGTAIWHFIDDFVKAPNKIQFIVDKINGLIDKVKKKLEEIKNDKNLQDIGDKLQSFVDKINQAVKGLTPAKVLLFAFGVSLVAAVWKIGNAFEKFGEFAKAATDLFGITSLIKKLTAAIKATTTITQIAASIAIIAGALKVIAAIPKDDLKRAVLVIAGVAAALTGISFVLSRFNAETFSANAKAIIYIAGAIGILAAALWILSNTTNVDDLLVKAGALALLIATFGGVAIALNKFAPEFKASAKGIMALGLAVLMLTKALDNISKTLEKDNAEQAIESLIGLMVALGALAVAASGVGWGAGFGMLGLVGSILLLDLVLKYLIRFGTTADEAMAAIDKIAPVFVALAGVLASTRLAGANAAKAGVAALLISASLALLGYVIKQLKDLQPAEMYTPALALGGLAIALGAALALVGDAGKHGIKAGIAALLITAAVMLLSKCIKSLYELVSQANGQSLPDKLATLATAVLALAGLMAIVGYAVKQSENAKAGPILAMILTIGTLLAGISLLSMVVADDMTSFIVAAIGMVVMLGVLAKVVKSTSEFSKDAKLKPLIAMVAALGIMVAGLVLLSKQPMDKVLAAGAAMAGVMLAIGAVAKWSKDAEKGAKALLAIAAPLAVAAAGIFVISRYGNIDGVIPAMVAMAGVMLAVGGAAHMAKDSEKSAKALLAISAPLAVAAAGLYYVSQHPPLNVVVAAGAMAGLMIALGAVAHYSKPSMETAKALAVMSIPLGVAAAGLWALAGYNWEQVLPGAVAMSLVMIAIAGAAKLAKGSEQGATSLIAAAAALLEVALAFDMFAAAAVGFAWAADTAVNAFMKLATMSNEEIDQATYAINEFSYAIGSGVANALIGFAETMAGELDKMFNLVLEKMDQYLLPIFNKAIDLAAQAIDGFFSKRDDFIGKVYDFLTGGIDELGNHGDEFFDKAVEAALKFAEGFVGEGAVSALKSGAEKLVDAAVKAIEGLKDRFVEAGKYVALGFAEGIKSNAVLNPVGAAARLVGGAAISALKFVTKENSPSKVAHGIGEFFGIGFANGISATTDGIYKASYAQGRAAEQGLRDGSKSVSGGRVAPSGSLAKGGSTNLVKAGVQRRAKEEASNTAKNSAGTYAKKAEGYLNQFGSFVKKGGEKLSEYAGSSFGEIGKQGKDTLNNLTQSASQFGNYFTGQGFFQAIKEDGLGGALDYVSNAATSASESLLDSGEAATSAAGGYGKAGKAAGGSAGGIGKSTEAVKKQIDIMDVAKGAIEAYKEMYGDTMLVLSDTSPTDAAKRAIMGLAEATYYASLKSKDATEVAKEASDEAKSEIEKIADAYTKLRDKIAGVIENQMDMFKKFEYDGEKITGTEILENMQSNADAANRFSEDMQKMAEKGFAQPLMEKVAELGPKGIKTIEAFLKMSEVQVERANQLYGQLIELPYTATDKTFASWAYAGQMAMQGYTAGISSENEVASNKVFDVATQTLGTLQTALEINSPSKKTFAFGEFFSQGFIEGIASKANDVIASVSDLGKRTVENLGIFNDKSQAIKLGEDICLGLAEGIKSKTQEVIRAAKDMADAVLEATTDVLEINSPSKAFERIGMYSDEGLARGLRDYSGRVGSAAEALGRGALDNVQSAIEFVKDMLNEGLDDGPTITPVLDLSNVASGAGAIDGLLNGTTLNAAGAIQIQNDRNNLVDAMKDAFSSIMMADTPNGDITINVYGAQGQDPRAIAEAVEERLLIKFNRLRAARA